MATGTPRTMATAPREFAELGSSMSSAEYNYEHFRSNHLMADLKRTMSGSGIRPGELAPDFELSRADGGTLRLSEIRGTPVLLHFGSFT